MSVVLIMVQSGGIVGKEGFLGQDHGVIMVCQRANK